MDNKSTPKRIKDEADLRRLAAVVLDSNDAITVQDLNGNITAWNHGAEKIYGWSEAEALKMNIRNIVPADKKEEALRLVKAAEEGVLSIETQRVTKDGKTLDIWLTVTKLADDTGKMVAVATIERDFTEFKNLVEKKTASELEMVELKRLSKVKNDMIRNIAHSIKTPISNSKMATSIIADGINSEDLAIIKSGYSILQENITKALDDLESIIKIGKLELGADSKEAETVLLSEIIDDILKNREHLLESRHVKVSVNINKGADKVKIAPIDIRTLLEALVDNAIKFTGEGDISITTGLNKSCIEIKVTDTGIGIDSEIKNKIFDKFFKADNAADGVGLGLSICKQIVERWEGTIEAMSGGRDKGTTMIVCLPGIEKGE